MKHPRMLMLGMLAAICAASSASAHGPGAHVHGVARLDVAVDGGTLTLGLESPLDNLLGFEHLPRTEAQRAAVRAMKEVLGKPESLFVASAAAQCVSISVKLESPVLEPAAKDAGDGHADLDGEFVFRCAHPEALHGVEVKLFAAFPHLQRVNAQIAGPRNQTAVVLTAQQPRAAW